jgi:hypothetical protein
MKYGIVNAQGLIENAIVLEEGVEFQPDAGYTLVRIDNVENCGIGWTYINGVFTEPTHEEPVQPTVNGAQTL